MNISKNENIKINEYQTQKVRKGTTKLIQRKKKKEETEVLKC